MPPLDDSSGIAIVRLQQPSTLKDLRKMDIIRSESGWEGQIALSHWNIGRKHMDKIDANLHRYNLHIADEDELYENNIIKKYKTTYEYTQKHQGYIRDAMLPMLLKYCNEQIEIFRALLENKNIGIYHKKRAKEICSRRNSIEQSLALNTVVFNNVRCNDEIFYVGYVFEWEVDPEHGLGVLTKEAFTCFVGPALTAYCAYCGMRAV